MTTYDAVTTQAALMTVALRLVDEHPDVPAGSVLRCFSRAVVITRRSGVQHRLLVERSESLARQMLAARNRPGTPGVPQPRSDRDLPAELQADPV